MCVCVCIYIYIITIILILLLYIMYIGIIVIFQEFCGGFSLGREVVRVPTLSSIVQQCYITLLVFSIALWIYASHKFDLNVYSRNYFHSAIWYAFWSRGSVVRLKRRSAIKTWGVHMFRFSVLPSLKFLLVLRRKDI